MTVFFWKSKIVFSSLLACTGLISRALIFCEWHCWLSIFLTTFAEEYIWEWASQTTQRTYPMCFTFPSIGSLSCEPEKNDLSGVTYLPYTCTCYFDSNGGKSQKIWFTTFLIIIKKSLGDGQPWDCGLSEVFEKHSSWTSSISWYCMPFIETSVGKDQSWWDFTYLPKGYRCV